MFSASMARRSNLLLKVFYYVTWFIHPDGLDVIQEVESRPWDISTMVLLIFSFFDRDTDNC